MRRRGSLIRTLEQLREGSAVAADGAKIAELVVAAADQRIGISTASFFRICGPVVSPGDFVVVGGVAPAALVEATTADLMRLVDRELLPFAEFFASKAKSFDIERRWGADFIRSTRSYTEYWHPWGVERQLVGALGTAAAPRGFVCVARRASEKPFTADDLRAFDEIRRELERALEDQHAPARCTEEALAALSSSGAPCVLFDDAGTLLWLTEAACERLSLPAARVGSSLAIGRSAALEELCAWVRAHAAAGELAAQPPPPAGLGAPGERFAVQRFEERGRTRFLVTLHPEVADSAALSSAHARAEALAKVRGLTRRQTEVLAQLATGQGNKAIAAQLACSEKTVELHVSALFVKLGCASRTELVARFWTR